LSLAVVRDLREARVAAGPDELAALETDVFAGFVWARAAAGLADATIVSDVVNLEQIRVWFGRPLWEMEPPDADAYFGRYCGVRPRAPGRHAREHCVSTSCSWKSGTRWRSTN
jgi:integrase/recombinase XerD